MYSTDLHEEMNKKKDADQIYYTGCYLHNEVQHQNAKYSLYICLLIRIQIIPSG